MSSKREVFTTAPQRDWSVNDERPPVRVEIIRTVQAAIVVVPFLLTVLSWWAPPTRGLLSSGQLGWLWFIATLLLVTIEAFRLWRVQALGNRRADALYRATPETNEADRWMDTPYPRTND